MRNSPIGITLDGADLAGIALERWRDCVSAAFEDFQRFHFLLSESVGVGDLAQIEEHEAVRSALARADGAAIEADMPQGLATRVGNRASTRIAGIDQRGDVLPKRGGKRTFDHGTPPGSALLHRAPAP